MQNHGFILSPKSHNQKTGVMAVTTSCKVTCPDACPLKAGGGCYGEYGPLAMHWRRRKDDQLAADFRELMAWIRELPEGEILRHNQVGDLMGSDDMIDPVAAANLLWATRHLSLAYTYTHYPVLETDVIADHHLGSQAVVVHNRRVVEWLNGGGFTVNISANSVNHADAILASGLKAPVVAPVREDFGVDARRSPKGNTIVVCPAILSKKVKCRTCKLCMKPERSSIIVFPSHGTGKKHADATVDAWDAKYQ